MVRARGDRPRGRWSHRIPQHASRRGRLRSAGPDRRAPQRGAPRHRRPRPLDRLRPQRQDPGRRSARLRRPLRGDLPGRAREPDAVRPVLRAGQRRDPRHPRGARRCQPRDRLDGSIGPTGSRLIVPADLTVAPGVRAHRRPRERVVRTAAPRAVLGAGPGRVGRDRRRRGRPACDRGRPRRHRRGPRPRPRPRLDRHQRRADRHARDDRPGLTG